MKKLLVAALLFVAATSHAEGAKSCADFRTQLGLKPGEMLPSDKLTLIREKSLANKAQRELVWGLLSVCGVGVPKDVEAGVQIWEKAHAEGNEYAASLLIMLYAGLLDTAYDQTKFLFWLDAGAKQGDAESQSGMAALLFQGKYAKRDDVAAERWWLKSAAQGYVPSYALLGGFYFSKQMYAEALRWFSIGAALGRTDAQVGLGALYSGGFGVARDHRLALQWWREAAEKKVPAAQFAIGTAYANAWGGPRDEAQALRWFQLAADQGSPAAQESLASAYELGQGVMPDPGAALAWRKKATDSALVAAQQNLMRLYPDCCIGDTTATLVEMSKPYRQDAESGNSESQLVFARFLLRHKEQEEALTWYLRAIAQGNAVAMEELGTMYFSGIGLPANVELGLKFTRLAAEKGRALAQARLGSVYQKGVFARQSFVAAYALYFAANSPGQDTNRLPDRYHLALEESMSEAEVNRAKQLIRDMALPGNFLAALDKASAP